MKVKFKIEDIVKHKEKGLLDNEIKYYDNWKILPENFHLTFNNNYNVYGIYYDEKGFVNFLILDDTGLIYPKFYPSEFFEVIDYRISKYFIGTSQKIFPLDDVENSTLVSYPEVVKSGFYYDDFLESKSLANETFVYYKKLIDLEFFDQSFDQSIKVDENWFQCPKCDFVWEIKIKISEVVACPNCSTYQNIVDSNSSPR